MCHSSQTFRATSDRIQTLQRLHQACDFLYFDEKVYKLLQLLFDYRSKSGHVTNSSKKPFKALKGSVALRLWHRTACFAVLFLFGFHEALASEGRNQPSNNDLDAGTVSTGLVLCRTLSRSRSPQVVFGYSGSCSID